MLNSSQIWTPKDLDTVSVATALMRCAQTLIGHDDYLARAMLYDAVVMLDKATGAFATPVQARH